MKRLFPFLFLLIFSLTANSQVLISILLGDKLNSGEIEFGLGVGYSMTDIINEPVANPKHGLYLGFYFNFLLKEHWYLYTGVHVKSAMGASGIPTYSLLDPEMDSVFLGGDVTRRINYFNVPIEIKYRFENNIHIDAGFQLGLRHKSYDEFTNTLVERDDLIFKHDIRDEISRLDAGVSGGAGWKFRKGIGVTLGARYYYGLVNIYKNQTHKGTNSALYIYADIPIGAGKKE